MTTALPPHIQRQLDAANAIEAQLAQEVAQPQAPLGTVVPAAHTLESGTVVDSAGQPRAAEAPAADPEPPPSPPAPPPKPAEDWEHKFKTLQGMYSSHVPKLNAQVKELTSQLDQMRAKLTEAPPAEPQKPVVDPKDAETFGADLVDMVARVAETRLQPLAKQLERRLVEIEARIGGAAQAAAQTAEQVFLANVTRLVPDWDQINADPQFLEWLDGVDPIYGERRQVALDRAQQLMDAQRAANVFLAFKAITAPRSTPAPAAPRPSLEAQVAPRAVAAPTPAPAADTQVPVITQAQISRFYGDVSRGRYRGREQEAAAIEAQINQAVSAGRVR